VSNISGLFRAARKRRGLTQVEVAKHLGISQGNLSRIEKGLLIPSAPQWFDFTEMTSISPDSIRSGFIDRNTPSILAIRNDDIGFKLPEKYSVNRGSKTRAMLPFISFFDSVLGKTKLHKYLKSYGVDPDFFIDLDNQINIQFCLDMVRYLIERNLLKPNKLKAFVPLVKCPVIHGTLKNSYANQNSIALTQILVQNSKHYECNFDYKLEESRPNEVVISIAPEAHMKETGYRGDKTLGDFLCQYKKTYFEAFSHYGDGQGLRVEEKQCHYKGADSCVYKLKAIAS